MMGMFNPMSAVTSNLPGGGDDDAEDTKEKDAEQEAARQEAIAEAEERRKKKHAAQEEEREGMRQGIRDKYNIKKREVEPEFGMQQPDNPLMRTKKTPEELAAEAEAENLDDFTKLKNTIETQISDVKTQIEGQVKGATDGKCSIQ